MKTKTLVWNMPNGKKREVKVGDILLSHNGKTFFVTGWNEFDGTIEGTTTCKQHYFIKASANILKCEFVEGGV